MAVFACKLFIEFSRKEEASLAASLFRYLRWCVVEEFLRVAFGYRRLWGTNQRE